MSYCEQESRSKIELSTLNNHLCFGLVSGVAFVVANVSAISAYAAAPLNPEINVGIRQRFGEQSKDQLILKALPGDRLTIRFSSRNKAENKVETLTAEQLQVGIAQETLAQPQLNERLVLSTHRSFESAETSANNWRTQGVEVEVAQPKNWQVWAKRDRYDSTVTRLLLLQDLKSKGLATGYLDRSTQVTRPQLSWVVNGYRYNREGVDITAGSNVILVGTKRYGGQLRFQPNTYGTFTLVNRVSVETYLRGVVPYEIGPNAPETAVQAQAILARTYALRNLRRFQIDGYELCADTQCQVYEGLTGATAISDRAVEATAGQVLTYSNELVDALYSSTTGGVTAAFEDVWEGTPRPYLRTRIDAYPNRVWDLKARSLADEATFRAFIQVQRGFNEDGWDYLRWRKEVPLKQLNQNLRDFLKKGQHPMAGFTTIQKLAVVGRSQGGRVQRLQVTTDLGVIELTKDEILRAFEAPNSLLFLVDPIMGREPGRPAGGAASKGKGLTGFLFAGGGLGHGVGLSQTGSYALSQQGWAATRILKFYYPNTELQPLTTKVTYWKGTTISAPTPAPTSKTSQAKDFHLFSWNCPKIGLQSLWQWFQSLVA
jgi:SpoIID/LytB domain protein